MADTERASRTVRGFPVFRVQRNARKITLDDVKKLEDEA